MSRLVAPCLEFIADILRSELRKEAANEAIMEPFWNGIPEEGFGGLLDWHQQKQRKLIATAEAEAFLRAIAPHEMDARTRYNIPGGTRLWGPYQGFRRREPA